MPEFMRIANPRRKKNRKAAAKPAKRRMAKVRRRASTTPRKKKNRVRNGGVLTLMANPKRSRKRNRAARRSNRRRSNPMVIMRTRNSRRAGRKRNGSFRRRRNPSIVGYSAMGVAKLLIGAGAGAVATRAITQAVLKDKNQGLTGYGANLAVAIALAMGTGKFLGNEAGGGVLAGGLAVTVQRFIDDKRLIPALTAAVSATTGQSTATSAATVKGLGDISYSEDGLGSLGMYLAANFPITTETDQSGYAKALPPGGGSVQMPAAANDNAAVW